MKITFKGDYALKAVLDLALYYDKELVTGHQIAQHIDAPVKFLEQVLLELKNGRIIESRRGKEGGYLLTRNPADITIGEVIRLIDGPIEPISCAREGYSNCTDLRKCIFRPIWQQVSQATSDIIDHITFAELAVRIKAEQEAVTYSI